MGIRAIIAAAGIAGCGDDTGTRMAALPAMPQQVRAQGLVAEGVALVGQEIRLGPGRAVVVPDTTAATVWLERVAQLAFDPGTDHLLALNAGSAGAVEFTLAGRLVRRYSTRGGRGPGEMRRAERFAFGDRLVVIHDRGNAKLVLFDRASGTHTRDVTLQRRYSDLALAPAGTRVFLVPGDTAAALDILDLESGAVESVGSVTDLPLYCDRADCPPRRELCTGCRVLATRDSLIVVLNTDLAALVTFDSRGTVRARLPFNETHPLLRRWQEEDAPLIDAPRTEGGARVVEIKSYFMDIGSGPHGSVVVPVIPSNRQWRQRGNELWLIHPLTGHQRRYLYPERLVGYLGTFGAGEAVGYNPRTGGIYRFRIPPAR